jgi:hypothetical protein
LLSTSGVYDAVTAHRAGAYADAAETRIGGATCITVVADQTFVLWKDVAAARYFIAESYAT